MCLCAWCVHTHIRVYVLAQDWVCTLHVCALWCTCRCVHISLRVSCTYVGLCVSVHTCAYLCTSLSPYTCVPWCSCAHDVSDHAFSCRLSSCQTPSPPSCAPCSRGCCSEMSTGGWAAWGAGKSRWAPGWCTGLGQKGREGGHAGAAPWPRGCSQEPAALTPPCSPGLRR